MLGEVIPCQPENPVYTRLRLEPAKGPDPPREHRFALPRLRRGEGRQLLEARQLQQQPLGQGLECASFKARFSPESVKYR